MHYNKIVTLKNGKECHLRHFDANDGRSSLENYIKTNSESDYLLHYPDEIKYTVEEQSEFVKKKAESSNEILIAAIYDSKIVASAGIDAIGACYKLKHRCEFGISVQKEYWSLGIGEALSRACIECARLAGYKQIELTVVSDNTKAINLYKKLGFVEFGRNSKGFNSRESGYQEILLMLLDLEEMTQTI